MHVDNPPAVFAATRAPSSPDSASGAAPAVAVATASAGTKRKSRAADDAAAAEAAVADSSTAAVSSLLQSSEEAQRTASGRFAAALSVTSPHAHLASLLESPSATAPVAMRTHRAHQSAQTVMSQARASPMIRLLGADSGARQSLLELMELSGIASLQCTGRSWRGWIAEASFIGARTISIKSDQQDNPSRCPWVRRSVQHLQFEDSPDRRNEEGAVVPFVQLLLLRWSRLRSMDVTLYHPVPSAELLQASFASVAATLQRLHVSLLWGASLSALHLLPAVAPLHQLESLTVIAMGDLTDLSALAALPRLQQFVLRDDAARPCSLAQVDALAQCRSLTDLECGEWLPVRFSYAPPVVELTDTELQQLEDGLGRLFRLRNENGAAPLRRLNLGSMSMILPQCWRVLSQFTALEELDAHWSCTLTAADWMLLANFPQLHALTIRDLERKNGRAPLNVGLVLPSLVRCRALRTLSLNLIDLRTEHVALLAQIQSLETFMGQDLRIESLEPLCNAPALTELNFGECVGLHGEPNNIRAMIPAMALVSKLTIAYPWHSRRTMKEAEPFNVALLARLPKLTPARFIQS